ncbi:MAG: dipeptide ABC transporter ATP-binding protein [Hydrogenophaga sp.]|nr:dipeptide ABC transporter ATP-binding protein [Hydrogenophaga sp.]
MTAPMPLLEVKDLRVAFAGREVVHGISFHLHAGEKLALVGESGSGKTVSALALLRLVQNADISGSARLNGRDLLTLSERELRGVRGDDVAIIFQEPMTALNPVYTVGDQIAEILQLKKGLTRQQASAGAVELLAATGIPEPARRAGNYAHQLSGGQRQRAVIAMALASNPKLLLADEPTTALDASLRTQMLDLLGRLQREHGMALLLITHDLNLVRRVADRVAVMEQGHLVEQGAVGEVMSRPQHAYTRLLIDSQPQRDVLPAEGDAPVLVEANALTVDYAVPLGGLAGWWKKGQFRAVKPTALCLRAGQTLGVIGESGSGKSTLALAALGLLAHGGELRVAGQSWLEARKARQETGLRRVVQVVFQDPFSSLSPRLTVEQIVGEGLLVHEPGLSLTQRRERVVSALTAVGLFKPDADPNEAAQDAFLSRYPHEFSGGQRQRLAIARALVVQPKVLVLDEPTSALDVTVQKQVVGLLQRLQRERGLSYLLITHDVAVVRAMAHSVLVMQQGEVVEAGDCEQVLASPAHPYTQALLAAAV